MFFLNHCFVSRFLYLFRYEGYDKRLKIEPGDGTERQPNFSLRGALEDIRSVTIASQMHSPPTFSNVATDFRFQCAAPAPSVSGRLGLQNGCG
jgi:hypothetical protein